MYTSLQLNFVLYCVGNIKHAARDTNQLYHRKHLYHGKHLYHRKHLYHGNKHLLHCMLSTTGPTMISGVEGSDIDRSIDRVGSSVRSTSSGTSVLFRFAFNQSSKCLKAYLPCFFILPSTSSWLFPSPCHQQKRRTGW